MTIGLLCVLLIPIDIFLTTYKSQNLDKLAEMIKLDRSYFEGVMLSKIKIKLKINLIELKIVNFFYF